MSCPPCGLACPESLCLWSMTPPPSIQKTAPHCTGRTWPPTGFLTANGLHFSKLTRGLYLQGMPIPPSPMPRRWMRWNNSSTASNKNLRFFESRLKSSLRELWADFSIGKRMALSKRDSSVFFVLLLRYPNDRMAALQALTKGFHMNGLLL